MAQDTWFAKAKSNEHPTLQLQPLWIFGDFRTNYEDNECLWLHH
jgi:hypothetical protein